jgi:glycosyltransferase involved in cell wall biosynthesis
MLEHLDPGIHRFYVGSAEGPVLPTYVRRGIVDEARAVRWRGAWAPVAALRILGWAMARRRRLVAIQANNSIDVLLALPAAVVSRRPLIAWMRDQELKRWAVRLAPLIRHLGVRWLAVSQFTARDLVDAGLARPGEVTVLQNPVDPRLVAGVPRVADPDVRIGFLGTDSDRKGFSLLAEIAARVTRKGVRLLVFANRHDGVPDHIVAAWRTLDELGAERVEIVGRVDDVREAYARCDVVFVPSLRESYCRVVVEAMANGVPVVASDLPPIREMMGPDQPGFLYPVGDADAAVDLLRRLVDDEALRAELGAAGRARAGAFAPRRQARQLEALYGLDGTEPRSPALDASQVAG